MALTIGSFIYHIFWVCSLTCISEFPTYRSTTFFVLDWPSFRIRVCPGVQYWTGGLKDHDDLSIAAIRNRRDIRLLRAAYDCITEDVSVERQVIVRLRGSNRSPDILVKCPVMVWLLSWLSEHSNIMSQPGTSQVAEAFVLGSSYCTRLITAPLESFFFTFYCTSAHTCLHAPCVASGHETHYCMNSAASPLPGILGTLLSPTTWFKSPCGSYASSTSAKNLVLELCRACEPSRYLSSHQWTYRLQIVVRIISVIIVSLWCTRNPVKLRGFHSATHVEVLNNYVSRNSTKNQTQIDCLKTIQGRRSYSALFRTVDLEELHSAS
jgi:hypothetical protein